VGLAGRRAGVPAKRECGRGGLYGWRVLGTPLSGRPVVAPMVRLRTSPRHCSRGLTQGDRS
jgi:hypothetical protein